jgi:hypothetical protein
VTTYETITAGLAIFGAVTSLGALVYLFSPGSGSWR